MRIVVAGINHHWAPLALRERLSFSEEQIPAALQRFNEQFPAIEAAILSTCNRSELYLARLAHGEPQLPGILQFLQQWHGVDASQIESHMYYYQQEQAIEHLFKVAGSLDSMVIGESQILGQVNRALQLAVNAGTAGTYLNQLFQQALAVGKRIRTDTPIGRGRFSIGSVAADFARMIFESLEDKSIAIVGAGEMGQLTLRHLTRHGCGRLLICNRTPQRARQLADKLAGQVVPFEQLDGLLADSDVVITCMGADRPVITAEHVRGALRRRGYRTMFLLDIAVPRNIAADVGQLQNVYLYNIDDLQAVVERHYQQRSEHIDACLGLIREAVRDYVTWQRRRTVAPVISALRRLLHQIGQEELAWLMPKLNGLSERDRRLIEQMAHRMIHKILHPPTARLVEKLDDGSVEVHTAALRTLFQITPQDSKQAHGSDEIRPSLQQHADRRASDK